MKKTITLFAIASLFCLKAMASHYASAEIRYEYTGTGNKYLITASILKACEPGSINLTIGDGSIKVKSSCSGSFSFLLPLVSIDTINAYCGLPNSCASTNSIYPGYVRWVFADTVILSPCADWKISWNGCCRNNGVTNLINPGSYSTYVEATLNNLNSLNTNAYFPNPSPLLTTVGLNSYLPINVVDAENDSIDIQWTQPQSDSISLIPYNMGYSVVNPFGTTGTAIIDQVNNVLIINAPAVGKYALAFTISEYRAGVLIAKSMRDFNITSINGTTATTVPMPASGTSFNYITCPGQTNSLSYNFIDSTVTDSVFLTVTPPVIPGFTFTTATTSAAGSANATISWTTPSTLNPATLPQFYISIFAKDNACPASASAFYAIAVQTAQCNTDSVWAGDANGDYTVNIYDPLAIAVAFAQTGTPRLNATTNWQAEYSAPWANSFINGVNMKHADCNGDGIVNNADLPAVTANWGLVHPKGNGNAKTTGVPNLYFDVSNIVLTPNATISVPIMFGDASNMVNNFYGIGTRINIGGLILPTPATITYPSNSWLGNAGNTLRFAYTDGSNNGTIDWSYARTDHQNATNGMGQLATLNFTLPSSIPQGSVMTLGFDQTIFIDNILTEIAGFNTLDTTVDAPLGIENVSGKGLQLQVVPNPSGEVAQLQISVRSNALLEVMVSDAMGRVVSKESIAAKTGSQTIGLPTVASGVYFIHTHEAGKRGSVVKWIRN